MNKTFKLVFNRVRGKMMVVNEMTRSTQKSSKRTVTILAAGLMLALPAAQAAVFAGAVSDDVTITKNEDASVIGVLGAKEVTGKLTIDVTSTENEAIGIQGDDGQGTVTVGQNLKIDAAGKKYAHGVYWLDELNVKGNAKVDASSVTASSALSYVKKVTVLNDMTVNSFLKEEDSAEGNSEGRWAYGLNYVDDLTVNHDLILDIRSNDKGLGIYSLEKGIVGNDLTLDVSATNKAYGIWNTQNLTVKHDTDLTVTSTENRAYGLLTYTAEDEDVNAASQNANAASQGLRFEHDLWSTVTGKYAYGSYGIKDLAVGHDFHLTVTADADACGLYRGENLTVNHDFRSTVTGDNAYGILYLQDLTVKHDYVSTVAGTSGAYGLYYESNERSNIQIDHDYIMTVNSDAYAYGMYYGNGLTVGHDFVMTVNAGNDDGYGICEADNLTVGHDFVMTVNAGNDDRYGIYDADNLTVGHDFVMTVNAGNDEGYGIYDADKLTVGHDFVMTVNAGNDDGYGICDADNLTVDHDLVMTIEGEDYTAGIESTDKVKVGHDLKLNMTGDRGYGIYDGHHEVDHDLNLTMNMADYAYALCYIESLKVGNNLNVTVTGKNDVYGIYSSSIEAEGDTSISVTGEKYVYGIKQKLYADNKLSFNGNLNIKVFADQSEESGAIWTVDGSIFLKGQQNFLGGDVEMTDSVLNIEGQDPTARSYTKIDGDLLIDRDRMLTSLAVRARPTPTNAPIMLKHADLEVTGKTEIGSQMKMVDSRLLVHDDTVIALLKATNSAIERQTLDSQLSIDQLNPASSLTLAGSGALNDQTGGDILQLLNNVNVNHAVVSDENFNAYFDQLVLNEGEVLGEVTGTLENGKLVTRVAANEKNLAKANILSSTANAMTRVQMNELRKRLGDVRSANGTEGAWARYTGGAMSGDFGLDTDFHMIQVGYDRALGEGMPRVGAAFSYARTESDDRFGSADSDAWTLAGYGVWNWDNGMFADAIARFGKLDTDFEQLGHKADVDSWMMSLSGEFGIRKNLTETFFVEPSAELTYTWMKGDDFMMAGAKRDLDDVTSLIARFGTTVGAALPQGWGSVYARANIVHEFDGDASITSSMGTVANAETVEGSDTWLEMGIGANVNVNKNLYVYTDLEFTEGADIEEDWRANVGVRYSF